MKWKLLVALPDHFMSLTRGDSRTRIEFRSLSFFRSCFTEIYNRRTRSPSSELLADRELSERRGFINLGRDAAWFPELSLRNLSDDEDDEEGSDEIRA